MIHRSRRGLPRNREWRLHPPRNRVWNHCLLHRLTRRWYRLLQSFHRKSRLRAATGRSPEEYCSIYQGRPRPNHPTGSYHRNHEAGISTFFVHIGSFYQPFPASCRSIHPILSRRKRTVHHLPMGRRFHSWYGWANWAALWKRLPILFPSRIQLLGHPLLFHGVHYLNSRWSHFHWWDNMPRDLHLPLCLSLLQTKERMKADKLFYCTW